METNSGRSSWIRDCDTQVYIYTTDMYKRLFFYYHSPRQTRLRLVVHPPVMLLLETQHLPDLPVAQRRLVLAQLPRDLGPGRQLLQRLLRRHGRSDVIVRGIEHFPPQPVLLDAQVADLAQIAGIDIAPGIPQPRLGLPDVLGEVLLVLVGFDDVADPKAVDVVAEAVVEGAGGLLAADLGQSVRVHWVDVVVFFEGQSVEFIGALCKAGAVGGLGGGDQDLLDAEFGSRFDHVVGGCRVGGEGPGVGDDHVAGECGEVDHYVGGRGNRGLFVALEVEVCGEGIEDLAAVL